MRRTLISFILVPISSFPLDQQDKKTRLPHPNILYIYLFFSFLFISMNVCSTIYSLHQNILTCSLFPLHYNFNFILQPLRVLSPPVYRSTYFFWTINLYINFPISNLPCYHHLNYLKPWTYSLHLILPVFTLIHLLFLSNPSSLLNNSFTHYLISSLGLYFHHYISRLLDVQS